MTRIAFLAGVFGGILFASGPGANAADRGPRPNIVLITADNLGYGDLGCYGNREIKTPHIDRLATQSVRLTDFYSASPTCTVSRATLLTGRYPQRIGLNHQLSAAENLGIGLRHSEILFPALLKRAGYATGCFGKWNIGFGPGGRPTERGFDEFFGHASGNIDYYTHIYAGRNDLYRGTEPVQVEGYSTDLFADAACDFMTRYAGAPFFVYLPFNAPHFPNAKNKQPGQPVVWQAPDEAFEAYGLSPNEPDEKKRYRVVVTALDSAIGRVMAQLDALHLAERTLVIFYSDNGAFMLPGRGLEVASNRPLRDGGITLYEGGIRVPCLVRWPGVVSPGTVCCEPLISLDFFHLATQAAGAELPAGLVLDGRDPTETLAGKAPSPHDALFFQFRKYSAVRRGRYKLVQSDPKRPFELYDLEHDLGETTNLAAEKPKVAAELQQQFETWLAAFDEGGASD